MTLLQQAVVFLAAAAFVVPLFRRLGFGSVIGYLVAGVALGPWGVRLVSDVEGVLHFAEIGVVLLLFVIGLELQPARLRVLRRSVFGLGSAQVVVTGLLFTATAWYWLGEWPASVLVGFGLALSSTAFVLQMLAEKKDLRSPPGRAAFGVLLFQDLAVIPLIALIPYLASGVEGHGASGMSPQELVRALLILAVFIVGGRYLLRPLMRLAASAQNQEIFTAASLLLVLGAAVLMESLGFSMGLGAFIAGVLVADSPYRHQLQTDIRPFQGLLLGLFFVAVGMSANLTLLWNEPGAILALTAALVIGKTLALLPMARIYGLSAGHALKLSLVLAQGGEFAFVLFTLGTSEGLLSQELTERLILAVTLSMAVTPFLYLAGERIVQHFAEVTETRPFDAIDDEHNAVVIAGFGRFGQIIARILGMKGINFTALESSPAQVDFVRRFGNRIYYGDATRLDLLRAAHVDRAKVFVLAINDVETSMKVAQLVKEYFPNVAIYARARNRQHAFALMDLGVAGLIRDTLLSSIALGAEVLQRLGLTAEEAAAAAKMFEQHDQEALLRQHAIHHDEEALIQSARESAQQLRRLFESDSKL